MPPLLFPVGGVVISYTAQQLAERFNLQLHGNGETVVKSVGTLEKANTQQLSFLSNPRYRPQLAKTQAGIVVLKANDAESCPTTALIAKDPYTAFAKIAALFEPVEEHPVGIHPSAVIHPTAVIDPSASIAAFVSIGANTRVDSNVIIGAGSVIGENCHIGSGSHLIANVTLVTRVKLGTHVRIHPGAVIGGDGFGLAMDAGRWIKVPQLGGVSIGNDCEIGCNTTIDRGALEDTILEEDVRIDNQVQIGHNVYIGAHTAMAGCSAIAGSTKVGRYCLIAGGAGISGHLEICDKVIVTAMTMVLQSITEPGEYSSGIPHTDNRTWRKNVARFKQLDVLARKIRLQTSE